MRLEFQTVGRRGNALSCRTLNREIVMNTFCKNMSTVVLVTAFAASPAAVHAKLICDASGANCINLVCLPVEKPTLGTVDVQNTELSGSLCLGKVMNAKPRTEGTSSRQGVLAKVAADCKGAGGVLQDKGSEVACILGNGKQPAGVAFKPPVPSPTNPNEPGLLKTVKPCPNGEQPPCGDRTSPIPAKLK